MLTLLFKLTWVSSLDPMHSLNTGQGALKVLQRNLYKITLASVSYIIDFWTLAADNAWNNTALQEAFYCNTKWPPEGCPGIGNSPRNSWSFYGPGFKRQSSPQRMPSWTPSVTPTGTNHPCTQTIHSNCVLQGGYKCHVVMDTSQVTMSLQVQALNNPFPNNDSFKTQVVLLVISNHRAKIFFHVIQSPREQERSLDGSVPSSLLSAVRLSHLSPRVRSNLTFPPKCCQLILNSNSLNPPTELTGSSSGLSAATKSGTLLPFCLVSQNV